MNLHQISVIIDYQMIYRLEYIHLTDLKLFIRLYMGLPFFSMAPSQYITYKME